MDSNNFYKALGEVITDILNRGDQIALPAFGTFKAVKTNERVETDKETGKKILVPPSIAIEFTPALKLVKQVKNSQKAL